MKTLRSLVSVSAVCAGVTFGSVVQADLPPPEGTKFVNYSFAVENLAAFPDFVVIAYPWSKSYGSSTMAHTLVPAGKPLGMDRRSREPKLYAMPRAAYESWAKGYKPVAEGDDPALAELVQRPDVTLCSGAPTPRFSLASDDKRDAIAETLQAVKIEKGVCTISTALSADAPAPKAPDNASPTAPIAAATSAAPNPATPNPSTPTDAPDSAGAPPGRSGCGSCTVGSSHRNTDAEFTGSILALLLLRRRRRSR